MCQKLELCRSAMHKASGVKLTEQGYTACNPVRLWQVCWNLDCNNKVGGVTGGRQHAAPLTRLVQWCRISPLL